MGFGELLHGGPAKQTDIVRIRETLLFEEPNRTQRVVRFAALLVLASAIATYGLLADSVATVIGAMIVAPLMLPIMGLAFGLSIGDRRAIASSLVVGLGGIVAAIAVGYVLSLPFVGLSDIAGNSQIMSRTSPRLIDLCAALATGLAGAFAMSRSDVSDTLPGVAIAISLVPPLANVGILVAAHRPDLASGSMLLFVTNYLAILLTGTFMFALTGFSKLALVDGSRGTRRAGVALALALTLVVTGLLAVSSYSSVVDTLVQRSVTTAAKEWLGDSEYRLVSVTATPDVRVVVAGSGARPRVADLRPLVVGKLYGRVLTVETVPETVQTVPTE